MPDSLMVPLIGAVLVAVILLPFLSRHRKREASSREAEAEALRYGLHEPVTLHPVIDAAGCILTGSCVDVCPEGDVFGLIDGRVKVIGSARCIGHGLCERACPMEAIQLVFGTEKRECPHRALADLRINLEDMRTFVALRDLALAVA